MEILFEKFPAIMQILSKELLNTNIVKSEGKCDEDLFISFFIVPLLTGVICLERNFNPLIIVHSIETALEQFVNEKLSEDTLDCECMRCSMLKSLFNNAEFMSALHTTNKEKNERLKNGNY